MSCLKIFEIVICYGEVNLDDFAGPEQLFFAERVANLLIYGTVYSIRK